MASLKVQVAVDERIPLLPEEQLEEEEEWLTRDVKDLQQQFQREYPLRTPPKEVGDEATQSGRPASPSTERIRKKHFSGNEMIVAVFVVVFDTKKGTCIVIVWIE